jgi:hypothetical protein
MVGVADMSAAAVMASVTLVCAVVAGMTIPGHHVLRMLRLFVRVMVFMHLSSLEFRCER